MIVVRLVVIMAVIRVVMVLRVVQSFPAQPPQQLVTFV